MTVNDFYNLIEASKNGRTVKCHEFHHGYYNSYSREYKVNFLEEDMSRICLGMNAEDVGNDENVITYNYYINE